MSNSAQVDGPITVSRQGVSMEKEFAEDEEFSEALDDLAADVEEFQEWRDELGEMFQ